MGFRSQTITLCFAFACLPSEFDRTAPDVPIQQKEKPTIECRVTFRKALDADSRGEIAILEVEIRNVSGKPINVATTYASPILPYLKREITLPGGVLETDRRIETLSPYSIEPEVFTLKPGDKWKAPFGMVGTQGPGVYRVKAHFQCDKLSAISPTLEVEIRDVKQKAKGKS
ncbi:MAG: hypothetical protein HY289_16215 [Planctomycetes bacterium]|nr:hypothetical protein [Planctomycetota bacterium]